MHLQDLISEMSKYDPELEIVIDPRNEMIDQEDTYEMTDNENEYYDFVF
jgi:hypothetical protein